MSDEPRLCHCGTRMEPQNAIVDGIEVCKWTCPTCGNVDYSEPVDKATPSAESGE